MLVPWAPRIKKGDEKQPTIRLVWLHAAHTNTSLPAGAASGGPNELLPPGAATLMTERDRKSTRLNSSHGYISYAVFCLKKKKKKKKQIKKKKKPKKKSTYKSNSKD